MCYEYSFTYSCRLRNTYDQDILKQFIHVDNKPVIVYTMEAFQNHPSIDAIIVVTLESWSAVLWAYANNLTLQSFVGSSFQEEKRVRVYKNGLKQSKRIAERRCCCNGA